jgi:hypothetical protein
MTSGQDEIALGREAWAKISQTTTFAAWKAIAVALALGRAHALRLAGANRPYGAKYARAFNGWLDENGFRSMSYGTRAACCKLADNIAAIETWRSTLSMIEQASQNHPETIIRGWRRSGKVERAPPSPRHVVLSEKPRQKGGQAIYWDQAAIKRAADAMREARSQDYYVMAKISLEAAVRSRDDLLELLNDGAPMPAPVKPGPLAIALAS